MKGFRPDLGAVMLLRLKTGRTRFVRARSDPVRLAGSQLTSQAVARPLAATVPLMDAGRQPFTGCPEGLS